MSSTFLVALSGVAWAGCGSGDRRPLGAMDASVVDASPQPDAPPEFGMSADGGGEATSPEASACTRVFRGQDAGLPATIAIDTSIVVNSFVPKLLFGVNSGYFISQQDSYNTQAKVQAAGNYFIRYPGGSSSDDYHWNGAGTYDTQNRWVPSSTTFKPGFPGTEMYRGTTSTSYGAPAMVTDGDPSTRWLSNADTAFPSEQWVYVDFGSAKTLTSVSLVWGTPYATSFQIQTWTPTAAWPPPYQAASTGWQVTSAGTVSGTGGTQAVSFAPVSTQFVRVLMTASSAGAGGAYSIAELTVSNGSTQLTANVASVSQSPTTASSTDPASRRTAQVNFDFEAFMKYLASFTPPAIPVLTVNVGTGTPQEAAAWVHYANVVMGYGIKYWQIGNEMEGNWETGGPMNAQDYVNRYVEYYAAMKAEDPGILVLGPVSGTPTDASNLGDGASFVDDFIGLLHAGGLDGDVDGIDFHWYPNWGPVTDATALATVSVLAGVSANLKSRLAATNVRPDIPVFLTEYNLGLGSPNPPAADNRLVSGLWLANFLGEFIRYFGQGGGTNLWNIISGWTTPDSTDMTAGDLGYLQQNRNAFRYQEHADYWAMQLMSSDWAIAGDTRSHYLVSSTSPSKLAVYADQRPDGVLSVLVVNTDLAHAYDATIQLGSLSPAPLADVSTFDSSNYVWDTSTVPYHAQPDVPPTRATYCGASSSTPFTFAPASITVLAFSPSGSMVAPLEAGAPSAKVPVLIDDMSDPNGAQIRLPPQRAGDVSGSWYTYIGGGSGPSDTGAITPLAPTEVTDGGASRFAYTAAGAGIDGGIAPPMDAGDIAHAACARGETPAAQYAYAAEGFSFEYGPSAAGYVAQYVDISSHTGIQFWIYNALATPLTIHFHIPDRESDPNGGICGQATDGSILDKCYAAVFDDLVIPPGWSFRQLSFAALAGSPYYGYPQPPGGDMTTATDVHFEVDQPNAGGGPVPFHFCVADVAFYD